MSVFYRFEPMLSLAVATRPEGPQWTYEVKSAIEKYLAMATARVEKVVQSIPTKAFRGELVLTEAELARREGREYEPAADLLKRIRLNREASRDVGDQDRKARRQ
jgi:hypothetical protein